MRQKKFFHKKFFSKTKWDLKEKFSQNETWNKIFQKFLFYKTRLRKSFDETKHFASFYTRSDIEL